MSESEQTTSKGTIELAGSKRGLQALIQLLSPFIGLAVVILIFSILVPEYFLTGRNIETVSVQTVVIGLGAAAVAYRLRGDERGNARAARCVDLILKLLFFVFSSTSTSIFQAFDLEVKLLIGIFL